MKHEENQIESLLNDCWELMISDPAQAFLYAQQANKLASKFSEQYCRALSYQGLCQIYQGKFEEAIKTLSSALTETLASEESLLAIVSRINNALGMAYQGVGKYNLALDHYEFASDIERQSESGSGLLPSLLNTAFLFFDMGDFVSAELQFNELMGLDFTDIVQDNLVEVYILQAQLLLNHLNFAEAEMALNKAIELAEELEFVTATTHCKTLRGRALRLQGKLESALEALLDVIHSEEIMFDGTKGLFAYQEGAKTYASLGHQQKAIAMLHEGLERMNPAKNSPQRLKIFEQLVLSYEVCGNASQELKSLRVIRDIEQSTQVHTGLQMFKLRQLKRDRDEGRVKQLLIDKENQLLKTSFERLNLLNEVTHQVGLTPDFNELGYRLSPLLKNYFDAHFISMYVCDDKSELLINKFVVENDQSINGKDIPYDTAGSNNAKAMLTKEAVIFNSATRTELSTFLGDKSILPKSMLFMPLMQEDKVLGVFSMQSPENHRFGEFEVKLMLAIGKFLSIAVSNILSHEKINHLNKVLQEENIAIETAQQRIEYMAYHDSLTSLPNRQALEEYVYLQIETSNISKNRFYLVYIDLDGFKPINDTYGHRVGDSVLVELGKRINQSLRKEDFAARVGGDEYVLIINGFTTDSEIEKFLGRLLAVIKQPINADDKIVQVSASIGFASYPDKGADLDSLMQNADEAMYKNKRLNKGT